ncbi:MAG: sensor histidine kinase [Flavobacteriaceae bacterium]
MNAVPKTVREVLDDKERLAVLSRFATGIEDDPDLMAIAETAAQLMEAPVGAVSTTDPDAQRVHAASGAGACVIPVEASFCTGFFAPGAPENLSVSETTVNRKAFADFPIRYQGSPMRFYAGAVITVLGCRIGSLAVYDVAGRPPPDAAQMRGLVRLARMAGSLLRLKHESRAKAQTDMAFHQARDRHALALRAANIATWSWDIGSDRIVGDETLLRIFSLPPHPDISNADLISALLPADRERMRASLYAAIHRDEEYSGEFRTADGRRWLLGLGRVHDRAEDGTARSMFGIYLDITERKAAERKTRLLLRELNHRVKNTLAILQSVAQQTLRRSRNPTEFSRAFSGRLQALAAAHTLLSDEEWEDVDIARLLESQLLPYAASFSRNVAIRGPKISLGPDQALALSLVIHELATNAAQHGALSQENGSVAIDYALDERQDTPVLNLKWIESGGPEVSSPERQGFGSMVIRHSLDKIVGSRIDVDFRPQGMCVRMSVPLSV